MTKSILLGAVDTLEWWQVKPWVLSARESGFDGDIWLIVYRESDEFKSQAEAAGVNLYCVEHNRYMAPIQHQVQNSPTVSHNLRFYHAWELLTRLNSDAKYVIMTDVRDVIFQRNPEEFLEGYMSTDGYLISPSENIMFKDEPWNKDNIIKGYGETFYNLLASNWVAYNVGTIAGTRQHMIDLFHTIYSMTEGRYYPSDQSTFNVLVHTSLKEIVFSTMLKETMDRVCWAAQCGTTLDPTKSFLWEKNIGPRPTIVDGRVYNSNGQLYYLVHQWDRVPELKTLINDSYNR